ncbi:DUF3805 domain-containing protein [Sphingobacterium siyangense]|uniref:DUF3805 domain-containing protein n=1 Tax=Sphingobacterium siyangense TaxID=459529 RepID=UPI0019669EE0|nr:DUF3805 domain-containing protein [Sphingobacterium siyangense]QRY55971.1 DUF3805 domain-containing protein [Sphingobacterium siyangense]
MNYKQFTSNQGWISFKFPSNLINVEEDEGTYLFYTEDTGSFRITPLKLEGKTDFDVEQYLKDICNENNGEMLVNQESLSHVFYISKSVDEDEDLTIFNWIFAIENNIVYCSNTIDTETEDEREIIDEKREIEDIIFSLQID